MPNAHRGARLKTLVMVFHITAPSATALDLTTLNLRTLLIEPKVLFGLRRVVGSSQLTAPRVVTIFELLLKIGAVPEPSYQQHVL